MNTVRMTLKGRRPNLSTGLVGRTTRHLARAAGLFAFSGWVTVVLVHLLLRRLTGHDLPLTALLRPDMLWPTLALAAAVTFANYAAFSIVTGRTEPDESPVRRLGESAPADLPDENRLEHLTRSAERLDTVERDLIRKMSHSYPIDSATQRLLTEMRICTNRLRGQLCDLGRPAHGKQSNSSLPDPRPEIDRSRSPFPPQSDVKFDDVAVG